MAKKTITKTKTKTDLLNRVDVAIVAGVGLVVATSVFLSAVIINTVRFFIGR